MKTKKQKREELLRKFEEELKLLESEYSERVNKHNTEGYTYHLFPSTRQHYVESQIKNLKRNLGIK